MGQRRLERVETDSFRETQTKVLFGCSYFHIVHVHSLPLLDPFPRPSHWKRMLLIDFGQSSKYLMMMIGSTRELFSPSHPHPPPVDVRFNEMETCQPFRCRRTKLRANKSGCELRSPVSVWTISPFSTFSIYCHLSHGELFYSYP